MNSKIFWFPVSDLCAPPINRTDSQREINHVENRSGSKGRATKNFREFFGRTIHIKNFEILEFLIFPKDLTISGILRYLESPQEIFEKMHEPSEITSNNCIIILRHINLFHFIS